ncbi:MAG: hypothetical protein Q9170_004916 [Blastenia crenularia]
MQATYDESEDYMPGTEWVYPEIIYDEIKGPCRQRRLFRSFHTVLEPISSTEDRLSPISGQPFPLLKLPSELRRMVYREVLRPSSLNSSLLKEKPSSLLDQQKLQAIELDHDYQDSKRRTNLFLTSKQIYAEASEFWFATHDFKAVIDCSLRIERDSEIGKIIPVPKYLPKVRNLTIRVDSPLDTKARRQIRNTLSVNALKRLCYELEAHCPLLRIITLEIHCYHHSGLSAEEAKKNCWLYGSDEGDEDMECVAAEEFDRLLKPLSRLRNFDIRLKPTCSDLTVHHQQVFDGVAAVVRSGDPVDELVGNDKIWFEAKKKAEPFLESSPDIRRQLYDLHVAGFLDCWFSDQFDYDKLLLQESFDAQAKEVNDLLETLQAAAEI